jgi:DNA-binding MarR family transcriptional regulator
MKPKKVVALEALVDQSESVSLGLRDATDEIHADLDLSPGMRSLLRHLAAQGPATVPEIARARGVSRQHVQMVVNRFRERGLVKFIDNPQHQRSRLVRLNKAGKKLVAEMDRREEHIWRVVELKVKRRDLEAAAGVLSRLRRLLDSEDWRRAVEDSRS